MRELFPVLIVLFVLVAIAFAVAVGIVLWTSDSFGRTAGTVLVYETDPGSGLAPTSSDLQQLVAAIDRRVNAGWSSRARVRLLDHQQIEVAVFGHDPKDVERIERLLQGSGTLEFRILANRRDHLPMVEQALRENSPKVLNDAGDLLAWWVPVDEDHQSDVLRNPDLTTRRRKQADREILEALVVKDNFDLTGAHVIRATADVDQQERPCVVLRFNRAGAQLLGGLTAMNQPDPFEGFTRKLGFILDGRLRSAPAIQTTFGNGAEITGSFTKQEVRDLADVLNAGSLPVPIKQVERRTGAR